MYVDNAFHVENITVPYSLKDSGRMDAQGNFYFLGRTDDIVGVRGRKVSMMKIENALEESPVSTRGGGRSASEGKGCGRCRRRS